MNNKDLMTVTSGGRSALFGLATAFWMSMGIPTAWAQELFVTNFHKIEVYGRAASGDVYPFRTLGDLPLLELFPALAVDAVNDEIVALHKTGPYPASSEVWIYRRTADGSTAPIRALSTGLGEATSVAVDTLHDELYITRQDYVGPPQVRVYSRTASGTDAPLRTLVGAATGLSNGPIVIDTVHDELLVIGDGTVMAYVRTASGNTAPIRTLPVAATTGVYPNALALDLMNDEIFLANQDDTVTVYSRAASGSALPIRTFSLPAGSHPSGITVDAVNGEVFVTCLNTYYLDPSVAVYSRMASGSDAPIRVIAGASRTGLFWAQSPAVTTSPPPPHTGTTTVGLFRPGINAFYLWNSNTAGGLPDVSVTLGAPTDLPVVGDFNGDGVTTTGVFRPGLTTNTFFLRNTVNVSGIADLRIALGAPGDLPLVGDWNGDGVSTVGLFRPSTNTFYLWNYLVAGAPPDLGISVGVSGDVPIAGDWDGNGTTTIGLYRPSTSTFYLWNSNTAGGFPDVSVALGAPGDLPVVGDWDGNGTTTVGVFRPSTNAFYLWNSNSVSGAAPDLAIAVGASGDVPVVGNWDGL